MERGLFTPLFTPGSIKAAIAIMLSTVFPRSDAAATINFPLLALAATIRGQRLLEGGVNYTLHDSLLFSSINFDYVMFKSTIFGSDYC